MGTWGTAVFSDDLASDIREEYRDYLGDGLSGPDATDRLIESYKSTLDDPDEGPVFWVALALTQWKCGRVEARVQEHALAVIENGEGLERWRDDPKALKKRQEVLAKTKEQLLSPPPPSKRIAKRFVDSCPWGIGEMIGYRLVSGSWVLFRVIDYHTDKGGTGPICELLDWTGDTFPSAEAIAELPVRLSHPKFDKVPTLTKFMILRAREKELPVERVSRLGITTEPFQKKPPRVGGRPPVWLVQVYLWRTLDTSLDTVFGIK